MSPRLAAVLVLFLCSLATSAAFGLGADFPKEELARVGQLVDGQTPVHGYFVNWEDTFFYAGETADLNRFLAAYGKLKAAKHHVVLHAGAKLAASPWGKPGDKDLPCDWSLYRWNTAKAEAGPTRVDVWLGSRIKLDELQIPEGIEVASGGEIEVFIERHQKPTAKTDTPQKASK